MVWSFYTKFDGLVKSQIWHICHFDRREKSYIFQYIVQSRFLIFIRNDNFTRLFTRPSSNEGFVEKSIRFKQSLSYSLIVFVWIFYWREVCNGSLDIKKHLLRVFWKRMKYILRAAL